jgi:membrane-associated protein
MHLVTTIIDAFLHLDTYLADIVRAYGPLTYGILFAVIFAETGFVITPFLPGDSLLFAAGALAASTDLNPLFLFGITGVAAIGGDAANYFIGRRIGRRAFSGDIRWLRRDYLDRTHAFYERYGGKTIFLARFVPIVRTFAPFVAGVAEMSYRHFATYNVTGGLTWVGLFVWSGFFFGEIPVVKHNFELVVVAIIVFSLMPPLYEAARSKLAHRRQRPLELG